jgi:hypothetical protein
MGHGSQSPEHFLSVEPSVLFFLLIELIINDGITDKHYTDGRIPLVN